MNKKKTIGIILCSIGIALARLDSFMPVTDRVFFLSKTTGIIIAFTGIAFFGSGLKRVVKKVKACPECFTKNEISEKACKKCKKPFPEK